MGTVLFLKPKLADKLQHMKKMLYLIVVIGLCIIMICQLYVSVSNLASHPVGTNTKFIKWEPDLNVSVTVCNFKHKLPDSPDYSNYLKSKVHAVHTRKDDMSNWESKYENRTANASDFIIWSFSEEIFLCINLPVTGKEVKITHNIEIEYRTISILIHGSGHLSTGQFLKLDNKLFEDNSTVLVSMKQVKMLEDKDTCSNTTDFDHCKADLISQEFIAKYNYLPPFMRLHSTHSIHPLPPPTFGVVPSSPPPQSGEVPFPPPPPSGAVPPTPPPSSGEVSPPSPPSGAVPPPPPPSSGVVPPPPSPPSGAVPPPPPPPSGAVPPPPPPPSGAVPPPSPPPSGAVPPPPPPNPLPSGDGKLRFINLSRGFTPGHDTCLFPCRTSIFQAKPFHVDKVDLSKVRHLIIRLEDDVEVLESEYIYTIWEFTAEFGGWVGILFGFCILDIAGIFINAFNFVYFGLFSD